MSFQMNLWKVDDDSLVCINKVKLDAEERLETWIEQNSSILGIELLIIGRQVSNGLGGRIDLLGLNRQGDLVILELKRDRTPREVVVQILDYASWARKLTPSEVNTLASKYLKESLSIAFQKTFDEPLPDSLNANHSMIIVASEIDEASERIVEYLAEEYKVNINVVFFTFFKSDNEELLGRAWLMDPEEVEETAESRTNIPWSGYWFVNVGEGLHRNWDDNMRYGYMGAGQGSKYSRALKRLEAGNKIFAYLKGKGYVGYGQVTNEAVPIRDFIVESESKPLLELLKNNAGDNSHDPELSEWAIAVQWIKTFQRADAKTFSGIFAVPNIACKIRSQQTVEFLKKEFGISE